jgi:hypothetical protein
VCVLHEPGVEIPSDYQGVVYLPLDAAGAWKFLLAKEMKTVAFPDIEATTEVRRWRRLVRVPRAPEKAARVLNLTLRALPPRARAPRSRLT